MVNALIITGDKVQDHEFIYPYYRLQEEGYKVDVAVEGGHNVTGFYGTRIDVTCDIPEVSQYEDWDLLILPGGAKAMEYMRQNLEILNFIAKFHAEDRLIGVICHGTQLLISAGNIVEGKIISGYYSIKDDINNAGGEYLDAPYVYDQGIVSSPHYKHLGPWMKEIVHQMQQRGY